MNISNDRLKKQFSFLYEIDKLKTIFRQTSLIADPTRFENSAEHSWHLAFYVLILSEYANDKIDLLRVIKMVLLHDIVEIDAGDAFCYDEHANMNKEEKEQQAATRLFGLLPEDQKTELMNLWQEFEERTTADAKFAVCVDRIQPLFHNYMTNGGSWKRHHITRQQVETRMQPIKDGSVTLAELVQSIINDSVENNYLKA